MQEVSNDYGYDSHLLEHVFKGEVRANGIPTGFHCNRNIGDENVRVRPGSRRFISNSIVQYQVESLNGILKRANGGYSSFFDEDMSRQEVLDMVVNATELGSDLFKDEDTGLVIFAPRKDGDIKTFYPFGY